jgi:hypothetical protein
MHNRVAVLKEIINQQRTLGLAPCELHCNAQTLREFSADVTGSTPDRRSVLERLRGVEVAPTTIQFFEGLRVVENPALEGSAIILRPQVLMGDPEWLSHIVGIPKEALQAAQAKQDAQQAPTPWHQPVQKPADMQGGQHDAPVTAEALLNGGGVNCTTVIMKALENLDPVKDVIVLRFRKDRGIEICSTLAQYGVIGALQDALGHVARGEFD